ncbi:uncharacterized protein N7482_004579 [Penicillium canariense]|uniref:Uncharacterized protein n=1 Tax=Penicillium canariense TaxID=189055 RepID=A0A9W9LQG2_9EURO|nr:uncharacterized protein N7482_004579 [Penicillium canariense]KAJ5168985.1 hypothetical protein N7482_004579 [Penicillium canariense]
MASVSLASQLPTSLLDKRADITPGSPLYNCHESCGEVILISRAGNYCDNSTFTSDLKSCLKCALSYNIWKYYGSEVKSAADGCNDDATPSPSSATSAAVATATTRGTSSSSTTATGISTAAGNTTASGTTTASSAAATTGAASTIEQNAGLPIMMGLLAWTVAA